MSFRKRLLLLLLVGLLLAALDAVLAPVLIPAGIRLWLRWAAAREGLQAEIGTIDAPLLQPVTIQKLRLFSPPGAAREVSIEVHKLVVELNFHGQILSHRSAFLRSIKVDQLNVKLRFPIPRTATKELDWALLAQLVPENFRIAQADLDLTTANVAASLRGLTLSASAIEAGKFLAREVAVRSPLLRKTFVDLRGATSWEGNRLTIAGIPLVRGLDLEALTLDLSRLARRRVRTDLQLDAYGGTLRTSLEAKAGKKSSVDVAGSASNISLAQIASAFGFLEPITGRIRASKFTLRGNPGQFLDGTASVWMELTDFAWRERRADSVMLGATYYDRRLAVDQLYIRQRENQLTINGQLLWPKKGRSWMELPFRCQLSATIPDLNSFAKLFGATTGDFTGAVTAEGDIDALASEAHGALNLRGNGVSFRGVTLDSLGAAMHLRGGEITLESLEARHAQDFLRAAGEIDLRAPHRFTARLTGAINDLASYAPLFPADWQNSNLGGGATFDWRGDGTVAANSGTFQFYAHGLRLPIPLLRMPLDFTLEGSYSPRDVFFRTFQVGNDRLWLGGYLMLGANFVEFQSLRLTLDGAPRVTGTIFFPFGIDRWRNTRRVFAALDAKQKFDLDLAIDHLDLGKLGDALGEKLPLDGVLEGKVAAFGSLGALQITGGGRLQNFGGASSKDMLVFDGHYIDGRADGEATALFGKSSPVWANASIPLRLDKEHLEVGSVLDPTAPFSLTAGCSALFLEDLPNEMQSWAPHGLLSGTIAFSGSLGAPRISGEAQILGAALKPPPPWPELNDLSAQLRFATDRADISIRGEIGGRELGLSARLTTAPPDFQLSIEPAEGEVALVDLPPSGANLSSIRLIGEGNGGEKPRLEKAVVRGRLGSGTGSLTIYSRAPETQALLTEQRTFFLWPRSMRTEPLLLRTVPPPPISLGLPNERQTRWP